MNILFKDYLDAIKDNNTDNIIFKLFLNNQSNKYLNDTNSKRKVIDFIAGMTDDMFMSELKRLNHLQNN